MMSNDQIRKHVITIVNGIVKSYPDTKYTLSDEEIIKAGVELVINLLQNINTLVHTARGERP